MGLHLLVVHGAGLGGLEAGGHRLADVLGAEVGGHDDDGVLEVDHAALGVGEVTVLQDLQQGVEDVRVGLLDLVEQDHGEGPAAHLLGELATLVVADVAGRSAEEPRDRVLLGELGHVELDEGVLVVEQELRQGLGQLGLSDAGGAGEDEGATGALGVLQAGTGAADRLRQGLDGLVLTDDALVELGLHVKELGGLGLGQLDHRDAGGHGQDLGDERLVDLGDLVEVAGLPGLLLGGALVGQAALVVAQGGGALEVLVVDGRLLLPFDLGDLLVDLAQLGRSRHAADAQAGTGLVDQVDGLVRQEAVVDVAVGELGGGLDGLVGDDDAVEGLVAVAQASEDPDGLLDAGLVDGHRLEAALQGGVLLDLAVLVQGGGPDGLELTAGQHGLEDGGGVDGALGGAGTDEGVDLVDEQDDVAAGAHLLEDLLEALLEVAAVARAGHERAHVQGVELLVAQGLGDVAVDDGLAQALDDGGLAHARLPDEDGVVLGAPGEDLHDPLHLLFAADDRVQLALAGGGGEVAAELVQDGAARGRALLGGAAGVNGLLALVAREHLHDGLAHAGQIPAEVGQDLGGHSLALAQQAEEQVLGADVVVAELEGLAHGELEDLLAARREGDVAGGGGLSLADDLNDLAAHGVQGDIHGLQGLGGHSLALVDEAEKEVLGADVVVVQGPRLVLREHDDASGAVGKAFKHQ